MPTSKDITAGSQELMAAWFNKSTELARAMLSAAADAQLNALDQWFSTVTRSQLPRAAKVAGESARQMRTTMQTAAQRAVAAAEEQQQASASAWRSAQAGQWSTFAMVLVPALVLLPLPLLLLRKSFRQAAADRLARGYERAGRTYERARQRLVEREPEPSHLSQPLPEHR